MTEADYVAQLRRCIKHLQTELKALEAGITVRPAPDLISDHAIVRYTRRVKGIDMRRLKTEILPHERRGLLNAWAGRIKCSGYELVRGNDVVVTVI